MVAFARSASPLIDAGWGSWAAENRSFPLRGPGKGLGAPADPRAWPAASCQEFLATIYGDSIPPSGPPP
eukprot:2018454-Pyramimonas_sp.AAC.1